LVTAAQLARRGGGGFVENDGFQDALGHPSGFVRDVLQIVGDPAGINVADLVPHFHRHAVPQKPADHP
jgi:hypothetical protein